MSKKITAESLCNMITPDGVCNFSSLGEVGEYTIRGYIDFCADVANKYKHNNFNVGSWARKIKPSQLEKINSQIARNENKLVEITKELREVEVTWGKYKDQGLTFVDIAKKDFRYCEYLANNQNYFIKAVAMQQLLRNDESIILASNKAKELKEIEGLKSSYIANIGDRITIDVDVEKTATFNTEYGDSTWVTMKCGDDIVTWKSSNCPEEIVKGARIKIKGTVKQHLEREGASNTVLTRCKVVSVLKEGK